MSMDQSTHQVFISIYEANRTPVYHLALSMLRDTAAAEDAMQEVFLVLYENLAEKKVLRNVRAWLLTVTRNRCLNLLRDGRYERPAEELILPASSNPEDEVMSRLLSQHILRQISAEENLVFSLHCLDGYKYREIAKGLELPLGTVQTRCRTARQKLKAALEKLQIEPSVKGVVEHNDIQRFPDELQPIPKERDAGYPQ